MVEFTDILSARDLLKGYPSGMRVIVRHERPHPGAQLRFENVDGNRLTAFATNTRTGQLADLEIRHRRRARCEDRIPTAKDTGLTNLPLQGFAQNRIWLLIVQIANELLAWMGLVALDGPARRWEPTTLRHRIFTIAATLTTTDPPHDQQYPFGSGTNAHPQRHAGTCHTLMPESVSARQQRSWTTHQPAPMKDRG